MKYLVVSDMHFPKFKTPKQEWQFSHRLRRMANSKGYLNYLENMLEILVRNKGKTK